MEQGIRFYGAYIVMAHLISGESVIDDITGGIDSATAIADELVVENDVVCGATVYAKNLDSGDVEKVYSTCDNLCCKK